MFESKDSYILCCMGRIVGIAIVSVKANNDSDRSCRMQRNALSAQPALPDNMLHT